MNKSITTIIPFFNSGKDLSVMLDSILKNTVLPTEILLIDDGSTDESVSIAKEYASHHSFIKYVKQNHAGVSAARNLGIQLANSQWISFLDADDYIEPNTYELMLDALKDDYAGCICGYFTEVDNLSTPYTSQYPDVLSSDMLLKAMFTDNAVGGFLFSRLFNIKYVKTCAFNANIGICEDLLFQTELLIKNPDIRFAYVNLPLYHYVQSTNSATSNLNYFKDGVFRYAPAFSTIRSLVSEGYVDESYNSILEYSMYRLLKAYKAGDKSVVSQVRMLQYELKAYSVSKPSKRRIAYEIAPLLFSHILK